ncbi:translation elongation factor Ts, partial [Negativicoccus succinicivorans]
TREDVPQEAIDHEREVLRQQALNEGKPEAIVDKMTEGRLEKFYRENVLLEQEFVKDTDKSVQQMITEMIAKIGENISVRRFTRYQLGEGIEKRQDDFASEVMATMNQ